MGLDGHETFDKQFVISVVNLPDSLEDVIWILRMLAGTDPGHVSTDGDVSGNGRIGTEEAIRILRAISKEDSE